LALLVKTNNKHDEKFVSELLTRLGFSFKTVDEEVMEDLAFGAILKKNSRKGVVSLSKAKRVYKSLTRKKNQERAK